MKKNCSRCFSTIQRASKKPCLNYVVASFVDVCHRASRIVQIQATVSKRALELIALPDDRVPKLLLDISCGTGLNGETISENGHHWIGLDISASMGLKQQQPLEVVPNFLSLPQHNQQQGNSNNNNKGENKPSEVNSRKVSARGKAAEALSTGKSVGSYIDIIENSIDVSDLLLKL
ncbi:hypothetical protein JHK87_045192 [Glycine soja]|nr:hypothetical protein JHK87_045192 [Glycine soja]